MHRCSEIDTESAPSFRESYRKCTVPFLRPPKGSPPKVKKIGEEDRLRRQAKKTGEEDKGKVIYRVANYI